MKITSTISLVVLLFCPLLAVEPRGAEANSPPKISIFSPLNGTTYRSQGNITILALASDSDGDIRKVEFFANEEKIGEISRSFLGFLPLNVATFVWETPPAGNHTLVARATDNDEASTQSKPVPITVSGAVTSSASIVITSPENGESFLPANPITIEATAVDPRSYISRVEFFSNEDSIGVSELFFFRAPDPGERIFHTFEWTEARPGNFKLTVRGKDVQGRVINSKPVEITVKEGSVNPFVERRLPPAYAAGASFTVELSAKPPEGTSVYAVEDRIPEGWDSVSKITDGGVFDSVNRKVKFGPYFDEKPRVLQYIVTPPSRLRGTKVFSGGASADGVSSLIDGTSRIDSSLLHPADNSSADFAMNLDEVTAYGLAWKRGNRWPIGPNPIPIDYVTKAGKLWRGGEKYFFDSTAGPAPNWWLNAIPQTIGPLIIGRTLNESTAQREISGTLAEGQSFGVTIQIKPAHGVSAQAVEDQIPNGLQVASISHDGVYDEAMRRVRWGPFLDDQPRSLNYTVSNSSLDLAPLRFMGVSSFDGHAAPVLGMDEPRSAEPDTGLILGSIHTSPDGTIEISGRAPSGQTVVIEATENFLTWTELGRLTSSETTFQFRDEVNRKMHERFYRLRRVEVDE